MTRAAAFFDGFAGGLTIKRDREDRERRREIDEMIRTSTPPIFPESGPQAQSRNGPDFVPPEGRGIAQPYKTTDPVSQDMAPYQRAFLNAVAGGESGGRYNVRYTPEGGTTFEGFDRHPGIFEEGPHGKSSAAGRYQFTKSTWDELGGGSFDPGNQDARAWQLAEQRYRARTGRELGVDLRSNGLTREMMSELSPTWAAFGKNQARHIATYNESLKRYGAAPAAQTAAVAAGPTPVARPEGFTALGIKATPESPFAPQAWRKIQEYVRA